MPRLINHQGRLTSATGAPQIGTYSFTFRLYSAATGGGALWTEIQPGVATDTEGLYSVTLGSVTPLTLDFDTGYYLSMEIDGGGEFSPRQPLSAVPYSMRAAVADSLVSGLTIGRLTSTETVTASVFVGSGSGLSGVAASSVNASNIVGAVNISDSTYSALQASRITGTLTLVDSTSGALPVTRISGAMSLVDSTVGTLLGDSVAAARSQLNVDSPTLVVDAANNRVGIDTGAPAATLSVGGQALVRDTVTALSFVGSGAGLTGVSASSVNAQNINGAIVIPDSVTGTLQATRITGSVSLVDSTSGTLPLTRLSGDTITRSEVQNLQINLTDSVTGFVSAARLSGRLSISDSTTGTILGDSVNPARSQLNVDSPTLVVDAANNRVGIDTSSPQQALSVSGQALVRDTVTALSFVGSGASITGVTASSVNAQNINGAIVIPDSVTGTLQATRITGSVSLVDSTSGALPLTRVSGDTITYTQTRALTWSLVDSTTGALPLTRVSGDTITRAEVQTLRIILSDSTIGTLLGDSVNPARSTLNVDSPTFVVDAAANRVGIDTNAPQQTLSVGGRILARDTVTALSFVGSGASLTNVSASSVNAQFISGSIVLPDSVSGTLQVSRINGAVSLVDSTSGALPITRVSGDTVTYTQARALTWTLVDSTTGALPLTRISGDTITRSEVQNLQINLTDSVTGFVSAARLSGRISISDSTTGIILGDSVNPTRSTLNVDSPTFVVDAANNRVGIDTNTPQQTLSVGGQILALDTVSALSFVGSGASLTNVAASSVNAQFISGSIVLPDSVSGTLQVSRINGAVSLVDSTSGALPITRVSGDTVTYTQARALTWTLVDSTTGALPLTRVSGDTITRSEVQNLQINLTDSVTGLVTASRINGRISISDSTTGTILGDSVNPARSTLNVDSPTFVVDAASNRVGIDTSAPSVTLSVGGQALVRDTVTALSFVGSGASLTNVAAASINAQFISGSIVLPDSVSGTLQVSRINGAVSLVDSTSGALPITRVSGDTVTYTQARALTWTLVDSTTGALPLTRISGDTITRSEVQNLQINLTDSVTGFVSAARLSGRVSISDSTTGIILGDSVSPARSTLNVDSPTFVVDAAANRVGIDTNTPQQTLSVGGQILARDTVTALSFVGSGASLTNVAASTINAPNIIGPINIADSTTGTLLGDSVAAARSQLNVDSPTFVVDAANNRIGINTNAPRVALDVTGGIAVDSPFFFTKSTTNTVHIGAPDSLDPADTRHLQIHGYLFLQNTSGFPGWPWTSVPVPNDGITLLATDTGFGANLICRDENGNLTNIAPHLFTIAPQTEPLSWSHWSMNERYGGTINIDMLKVVRLVERLSGQKLVFIAPSGTNPEVDVEALERYIDQGGSTVPSELERLENENRKLSRRVQELEAKLNELLERKE